MEEWHLSKYTLFTKPSNHNFMVAVNLMKGSQTIIYPDELSKLLDFKILEKEDKLFKKFEKQGLIVNYDELAMLDAMAKVNCTNRKINLTICPTLNCNFDCPYCFEKHLSGKMSDEIQNKILLFTEKIIKTSRTDSLFLTWYGGEPLLVPDIIENLSDKIINLCEKEKVNYKASIITNGYLLTQKIVDMLAEKKVLSYQITIDGIDDTHNKTRRLVNGNGTFEKIVENLRNLKIKGYISIRNNVHKDNINEIDMLQKLIKSLSVQSGNKIKYYPAIVVGNAAEKREGQVNFLNEEEHCRISFLKGVPFSQGNSNFCGAQHLYSITIDNEGRLYKCWEDVDKHERSFGTLDSWDPMNPLLSCDNKDIMITYLNLPGYIQDKECRECIWLPLCKGGCPSKRLFFKKGCLPYKDNPELYLSKVIEKNLKRWEIKHNINSENSWENNCNV